MEVIIDRFEGDYAVVELDTREMVDLPRRLVPIDAEEGDVLEIRVNKKETHSRRERIERLCEDLWE